MKLKNKKTGVIGELAFEPDKEYHFTVVTKDAIDLRVYKTLAELSEKWCDYEEPKTFWAISWAGEPEEYDAKNTPQELKDMAKSIGNYFETKEEAEKAVEKLKAWKRLKDKGIEFDGIDNDEHGMIRIKVDIHITELEDPDMCLREDFTLLFGSEHEPPKDFHPDHLKRMGVSVIKGGEE